MEGHTGSLKKRAFPAAYSYFARREMFFSGTRNVISIPTRFDHWTLSQASSNQSKSRILLLQDHI